MKSHMFNSFLYFFISSFLCFSAKCMGSSLGNDNRDVYEKIIALSEGIENEEFTASFSPPTFSPLELTLAEEENRKRDELKTKLLMTLQKKLGNNHDVCSYKRAIAILREIFLNDKYHIRALMFYQELLIEQIIREAEDQRSETSRR